MESFPKGSMKESKKRKIDEISHSITEDFSYNCNDDTVLKLL
jgi:hypothetical protein